MGGKAWTVQLIAIGWLGAAVPALAADIAPYRAIYSLTLASAKPGSGIVGASGAMFDEWGETCDGRTEQERSHLRLDYDGEDSVTITSTLVDWESKDGLKFRFNQRRTRDGKPDEELKGEARLDGPGKGGTAEFTKPSAATLTLPPGVLFPMAHTRFLIERARAGDRLASAQVFDGGAVETAAPVSAAIGSPLARTGGKPGQALLDRPSWRLRLAYFLPDPEAETPDYEESISLLDNGVVRDMLIDYGDYALRVTLDDIEPLPKPRC